MNKINKHAFSDLYTMSSGISTSKEQAGHGSPFVSFSTVFNNYFLPDTLTDLMNTSEKEQKTYSLKKDDILVTRTSETIDELAMSCVVLNDYPQATYSGFTKRLRPTKKGIAYSKYMAFYLRGYLFRKAVTNNAFMTLRASFNEDIFSFLNLYLPEYEAQKRIGNLLYDMERKIALNNRIILELEAMAKTIYDYWFVQFDFPNAEGKPYRQSGGEMVYNEILKREIPKGWNNKTLASISTIVSGGTPDTKNSKYYCNNGIAWITPNDLSGRTHLMFIKHGTRDITPIGLNNSSASLLSKGTVLLSTRAPIGYIAISDNDICTNQGFKSLIPNKGYDKFYIYYLVKSNLQSISKQGVGTTFKEVSKDSLEQFKAVIPPCEIASSFAEKIMSACNRRRLLEEENLELTHLRDWLLPMLMNGQATVE